MLLHRRFGKLAQQLLDEGRDVYRLHQRKIGQAVARAPVREPARRLVVRAPCVLVADISGEEFSETFRGLRPGNEQRRQPGRDGGQLAGSCEGDDCLIHKR